MGLVGARRARDILRNTRLVASFELICACQAADVRGNEQLSSKTSEVLGLVREKVPYLDRDLPLTDPIESVAELLQSGQMLQLLDKDTPAMKW